MGYIENKINNKNVLSLEEREYYAVSTNHVYWLDDGDMEFKEKVYGLVSYRITGPFRRDVFNRAIAYLIQRHEDLRVTFHQINERYYCRVEDAGSPQFEVEYVDLRQDPRFDEEDPAHLLYFPGHLFDLAKGPLFLVRLLHIREEEYILSMKLHHAIYDGWSIGILKRDLYTAYLACQEGKEPVLPVLTRQLKDFMAEEKYFVETNFDADKKYWNELYPDLPGDLIIPFARPHDEEINFRSGKEIWIPLPVAMIKWLRMQAGTHSTSTFIILQSVLMMYLAHICGQKDLVLGMLSFGRTEFPGSEEQIGFFSKMLFIRTSLNGAESFGELVKKVKRSNEDTRNHKACSLLDAMADRITPKPGMLNSFWKVDVDFSDGFGYQVNAAQAHENSSPDEVLFQSLSRGHLEMVQVQTELKFHFYVMDINSYIDVRYDSGLYDAQAIEDFFSGYFAFARENIGMAMS